jgi:hypothetical protein
MTNFKFRTHESVVSGQCNEDLARTVMVFSIGGRPYFNRKALAVAVLSWRALKLQPSTAVMLVMEGYDDDPRPLWEIPEARDFIRRFGEKTKAHKHPALDPGSRNLLLLCGVEPTYQTVHVEITAEQSDRQTAEFLAARIKE